MSILWPLPIDQATDMAPTEHISPHRTGDSSVVLDRNGKPHKLSREHKPEDPQEARRIKQHGGRLTKHVRQGLLGVDAMRAACAWVRTCSAAAAVVLL